MVGLVDNVWGRQEQIDPSSSIMDDENIQLLDWILISRSSYAIYKE